MEDLGEFEPHALECARIQARGSGRVRRNLRQPFRCQLGGIGARIALDHLVRRCARIARCSELVLRVAELQQRIRGLARLRVVLTDGAKCVDGIVVVARDVVALAEPVLRIVGQRALRIVPQKILELRDGAVVVRALERIERMVIGGLILRPAAPALPLGRTGAATLADRGARGKPGRAALERGFEHLEPTVEIRIKIALLLAQLSLLFCSSSTSPRNSPQLRLEHVDTLRQRQQALIADHALDPSEALIDIVELDLRRVGLRVSQAAQQPASVASIGASRVAAVPVTLSAR